MPPFPQVKYFGLELFFLQQGGKLVTGEMGGGGQYGRFISLTFVCLAMLR